MDNAIGTLDIAELELMVSASIDYVNEGIRCLKNRIKEYEDLDIDDYSMLFSEMKSLQKKMEVCNKVQKIFEKKEQIEEDNELMKLIEDKLK